MFYLKDCARFPIINCQPSITIKKMILIGNEIITGGSIIIPKLIKIEATIISITKNGKKIKKPISNAVLNSETINAGINKVKETSSMLFGFGSFFIL